jgi:hypothetical protein
MAGGQDGDGAASWVSAGAGAGFFAGALRLGAAFFTAFFGGAFFGAAFFGAAFFAFSVFFFLAGAAFFFAGFFFDFDFFAMIVLPILVPNQMLSAPMGDRVTLRSTPRSTRCWRHRRLVTALPKPRWTWTPGGPINQLDRMDCGEFRARSDLGDAADIARRDQIRSQSLDSPDFALAQPSCDVGLQNIVGPGRAAAQMAFGYISDREAELGE